MLCPGTAPWWPLTCHSRAHLRPPGPWVSNGSSSSNPLLTFPQNTKPSAPELALAQEEHTEWEPRDPWTWAAGLQLIK